MRITEFVEKMAVRFDSKLSSPEQVAAFLEDCRDHLKSYEGEILGYAFYEIIDTQKTRTHPTISQIRKICYDKASYQHTEKNPHNPETVEWQERNQMVRDFKRTDQFKWCAEKMIGADVLLLIEKNGRLPTKEDVQALVSSRIVFLREMDTLRDDPDISETRLAIYKMGMALEEKNKAHFEEVT